MRTLLVRRVLLLAIILACSLTKLGGAEERPVEFQNSEQDFFDVLRQAPKKTVAPKGLAPKGLASKGVTKGPEAIVDDYKKLTENPTARSLILFDFDSADIKSESYTTLGNLAAVLKDQLASINLMVAGHTDSTGSEEYNLKLSQRRAQAVKAFLVSAHGIAPNRLHITGYGETQPLTANTTEAGRAQNRRVEFIRVE